MSSKKESEKLIKNSKKSILHSVIARHPAPIIVAEHTGKVISSNDAGVDLFSGKIIGKDIYKFIGTLNKKLVKKLKEYDSETVIDKVGKKTYRFTIMKLKDVFSINAEDISSLKDMENAFQEEKQRYALLNEAMFDGIGVTINGNIVDVNNQMAKMLGYEPKEMIGRSVMDFVAPKSHDKVNEAMKDPHDLAYEHIAIRKNGSTLPVEVSAKVTSIKGVTARITAVRDISERKRREQVEEEIREKLQVAKRMESLGILAGGIAHDLNNTLSPILGYPDLMLAQLDLDDPMRTDVEQIKFAAQSAAKMVSDLLSLARRGRYETKPISLNDVVKFYKKSAGFRQFREESPDVNWNILLEEDLRNINASGSHLSQVIMNLLTNALDSITGTGEITVRTYNKILKERVLGFEEIQAGNYCVLEVEDSGSGIAKDDLDRIFEPFFTTKSEGKSGTGLGLAVVYGIVKDHHGFIDINTEIGKGTKVTLYFNSTSEIGDDEQQELLEYTGSESILIVDDKQSQRRLASRMLETLGYEIFRVGSGQEAVKFVKKNPVDIILLDMLLVDGFDGLDTYKEIKKQYPNQKAVICTGFAQTDRVKELLRIGAGGYVRKPYTIAKLGEAIRQELDKSS